MSLDSLKQNFPATLQSSKNPDFLLKSFEEFLNSLNEISSDFTRWFPRFLRDRKYSELLWQTAQVEYLLCTLGRQSLGPLQEKNKICIQPDLTTQVLSVDIPLLGLEKGLYAFYTKEAQVRYRKLTKDEAYILDILSESLDFTFHQLVEVATLEGELREQKIKTIQTLIDEGLLSGREDL